MPKLDLPCEIAVARAWDIWPLELAVGLTHAPGAHTNLHRAGRAAAMLEVWLLLQASQAVLCRLVKPARAKPARVAQLLEAGVQEATSYEILALGRFGQNGRNLEGTCAIKAIESSSIGMTG